MKQPSFFQGFDSRGSALDLHARVSILSKPSMPIPQEKGKGYPFSQERVLWALRLLYTPGVLFYRGQVCLSHRKRISIVPVPRGLIL